ncbi:MAG: hypothetical protein AB8H47_26345 [Bacteroidia bacterium]
MEQSPASVIQLVQPFTSLFRSSRLSEDHREDGYYQLVLAPRGLSLLTFNRFALGALSFSTQYYVFHDDPSLARYMTPDMWLSTIVISLLGLWSLYAGINGLSESQTLSFREGEIHFTRDRLFFPQTQVFVLDGIASLQFRDVAMFRDRVIALDVPTLKNWEGEQISFFEYASFSEKRAAMRMIDAAVYAQ